MNFNGDVFFSLESDSWEYFLVLCLPAAQQVYCSSAGGALRIVIHSFWITELSIVVGQELGDPLDQVKLIRNFSNYRIEILFADHGRTRNKLLCKNISDWEVSKGLPQSLAIPTLVSQEGHIYTTMLRIEIEGKLLNDSLWLHHGFLPRSWIPTVWTMVTTPEKKYRDDRPVSSKKLALFQAPTGMQEHVVVFP